jgi:hypothetical protein
MIEIERLLLKLCKNENFAFNRFSDGEYYILNNDYLEISDGKVQVGDDNVNNAYAKFDHKLFDPQLHSYSRERLIQAFIHNQEGYYKGMMCKCCTSRTNYLNQYRLLRKLGGYRTDHLLSANLLVNGNFEYFRNIFLPDIFKRKIVIVCHESANLAKLNIVKDFRLSENSFVNELHIIEDISNWIYKNKIEDHVFLLSGSSWAKVAIHHLFMNHSNNTFIDIGTTMNFDFNMPTNRGYLNEYYGGSDCKDLNRMCTI